MRTNAMGVTEVAHLRGNDDAYKEHYDTIDWSSVRNKEAPVIVNDHIINPETGDAFHSIEIPIDEALQTLDDMRYLIECISISPDMDKRLINIIKKYSL